VAIVAAGILGLALAAPVLMPYVRLAASGAARPLEVVAQFSATPAGYLVSTSRLYARFSRDLYTNDVNVFFPGVTALALAAIGVWSALVRGGLNRRRILILLALAVVGIVLSFGPSTLIYRWLYSVLPPLRGIRAAARFGFLFLLAVAISAGFGFTWLERHLRSRRVSAIVTAATLALVTAEVWQGAVRTVPFSGVPAIYSLLADVTSPVLLVEVPFYPGHAAFENGEYVLNATAHWQPLMNGYSGLTPGSYRRRADAFWYFPADWAIRAIRGEGATHVMVHLERFGSEATSVAHALEGRADLRLMAADRDGHRLYQFVR
jgi:hypothetical protein